jgi:hypothetical protein
MMQFREFGQWIGKIADVHGDDVYVIFATPPQAYVLRQKIDELEIGDRFEVFEAAALQPGRIVAITLRRGEDVTVSIEPFSSALEAASRVDFKQQVYEDTVEAMERDEPYRVIFPPPTPEPPDAEAAG